MSVTRFKVGDRVRVREDIAGCDDTCRNGIYINEKMAQLAGVILTIEKVERDDYCVIENGWQWNDEMLEPAEKTLDNLCAGDLVKYRYGTVRKVLAAIDSCYLLSRGKEHTIAGGWYTADELEKSGYHPVE